MTMGYGYCCCCKCNQICGYQLAVCQKTTTGEATRCSEGKGPWCGASVTLSGDAVIDRINDQNPAYGTPPAGICRWGIQERGQAVWVAPLTCRQAIPGTFVLGSENGFYHDMAPYTVRGSLGGNASSDFAYWVGVMGGPGGYVRYTPGTGFPQVWACTINPDGSATLGGGPFTATSFSVEIRLAVERFGGNQLTWDLWAGGRPLYILQSGGLPTGNRYVVAGFDATVMDPFDNTQNVGNSTQWLNAFCDASENSSSVCGAFIIGNPPPCELAGVGTGAGSDILQIAPEDAAMSSGFLLEAATHPFPGNNMLVAPGFDLSINLRCNGISGLLGGGKCINEPGYGYLQSVNRPDLGGSEGIHITVNRTSGISPDRLQVLYSIGWLAPLPPAPPVIQFAAVATGLYEGQLLGCNQGHTFNLVGIGDEVCSANGIPQPFGCPRLVDPSSWPTSLNLQF